MGYSTIQALAAGIARAGSADADALSKAFEGLEFMSPSGKVEFRAIDHQSTLGLYVGKTALRDGRGVMTSTNTSTAPGFSRATKRCGKASGGLKIGRISQTLILVLTFTGA